MAYDPTADYANAYNALQARIKQNFADKRGQLAQDLAARGVHTSGVASIPGAALDREEALAGSDAAGRFSLSQAETGIRQNEAATEFDRRKELMRYGFDEQNALQRELANRQLVGQFGAGVIGGVGAYLNPLSRVRTA